MDRGLENRVRLAYRKRHGPVNLGAVRTGGRGSMRDGYDNSLFNPLPPVVWLTVLPIVAMELVLSAGDIGLAGGPGGIGWRQQAWQMFALNPEMLADMLGTHRWPLNYLMRFVTYIFVSQVFVQAVMVTVFILALGKFVAEVFRPLAFLTIFFVAGIVGAIAYSLVPGQQVWLIGGYPAVYGLVGAFTFIVWARLGLVHASRNRAFMLVGMLLGFQLFFWLLFGGPLTWLADLAGFVTGFALSFLAAPGGPAAVLARVRRR